MDKALNRFITENENFPSAFVSSPLIAGFNKTELKQLLADLLIKKLIKIADALVEKYPDICTDGIYHTDMGAIKVIQTGTGKTPVMTIDISQLCEGDSLLLLFCMGGNLSAVDYLVQHGADINLVSTNQSTPIMYAYQYGHLDIVKYFRDKGASFFEPKSGMGISLFPPDLNKLNLESSRRLLIYFTEEAEKMDRQLYSISQNNEPAKLFKNFIETYSNSELLNKNHSINKIAKLANYFESICAIFIECQKSIMNNPDKSDYHIDMLKLSIKKVIDKII